MKTDNYLAVNGSFWTIAIAALKPKQDSIYKQKRNTFLSVY